MAKKTAENQSTAKGVAKGAAAYFAVKKIFKGLFAIAAVAAIGKVLAGNRGWSARA